MAAKHKYDVDQVNQTQAAIRDTLTKRAEEGWRLFSVTPANPGRAGKAQLFLIWERAAG